MATSGDGFAQAQARMQASRDADTRTAYVASLVVADATARAAVAKTEGVLAYAKRPLIREVPNGRFLATTLFGVHRANERRVSERRGSGHGGNNSGATAPRRQRGKRGNDDDDDDDDDNNSADAARIRERGGRIGSSSSSSSPSTSASSPSHRRRRRPSHPSSTPPAVDGDNKDDAGMDVEEQTHAMAFRDVVSTLGDERRGARDMDDAEMVRQMCVVAITSRAVHLSRMYTSEQSCGASSQAQFLSRPGRHKRGRGDIGARGDEPGPFPPPPAHHRHASPAPRTASRFHRGENGGTSSEPTHHKDQHRHTWKRAAGARNTTTTGEASEEEEEKEEERRKRKAERRERKKSKKTERRERTLCVKRARYEYVSAVPRAGEETHRGDAPRDCDWW